MPNKVLSHIRKRDITLKQLARECWISYTTMAYIARGKYKYPAAKRVMEHIKYMEDR